MIIASKVESRTEAESSNTNLTNRRLAQQTVGSLGRPRMRIFSTLPAFPKQEET